MATFRISSSEEKQRVSILCQVCAARLELYSLKDCLLEFLLVAVSADAAYLCCEPFYQYKTELPLISRLLTLLYCCCSASSVAFCQYFCVVGAPVLTALATEEGWIVIICIGKYKFLLAELLPSNSEFRWAEFIVVCVCIFRI